MTQAPAATPPGFDTTLSEDDFREHQPQDDGLDVNLSEPSPRRFRGEENTSQYSSSSGSSGPPDDMLVDESLDEDELDAQEDLSWRDAAAAATGRVLALMSVYRLPLAFALITAAGPRCIKLLQRITSSDEAVKKLTNSSPHRISVQASPIYPTPPAWMVSARTSIPRSVESTVSTILHAFGVPTLSELQQEQLKRQLEEAADSSGFSDAADGGSGADTHDNFARGGIPFALLVPVASSAILLTAKLLIARHTRRLPSDNVSEDENDRDEASRSPLGDQSEGNAEADRSETPTSQGKNLVPQITVPEATADPTFNAAPNHSVERNTTRSNTSSEPTHGVRTTDPSRSTPRSVMLRQNNDALTGSIQKRRLDGSSPSPTSSPGRIPELNERSVDTPLGIGALSSQEGSPLNHAAPLAHPIHGAHNVICALTAPATHVEISALITGAQKYGVPRVVVPRRRRDGTTASISSPNPAIMQVEEVEDVIEFCKSLCVEEGALSVGIIGRQVERSIKLRDFHQPNEHQTIMYCFDPEMIAGDIVSHHTPSRRTESSVSSLDWCAAIAHVDHIAYGVAGMVNVCLLDHTKKMHQQLELSR